MSYPNLHVQSSMSSTQDYPITSAGDATFILITATADLPHQNSSVRNDWLSNFSTQLSIKIENRLRWLFDVLCDVINHKHRLTVQLNGENTVSTTIRYVPSQHDSVNNISSHKGYGCIWPTVNLGELQTSLCYKDVSRHQYQLFWTDTIIHKAKILNQLFCYISHQSHFDNKIDVVISYQVRLFEDDCLISQTEISVCWPRWCIFILIPFHVYFITRNKIMIIRKLTLSTCCVAAAVV